ncbi:MAG: 30S ribosomal protein S6 [Gammaproteobacteria bacterium]
MNNYELTLIVKPDLESRFDIFKESFEKSLSDLGFKIAFTENIGKRFLAYPIKKNNKGLYIIYQLTGAPSSVSDLENKLKYDNSLLRYFLQKVETHTLANSFLTEDTIEANKRAEAKLANKAKQDALEAQSKKSNDHPKAVKKKALHESDNLSSEEEELSESGDSDDFLDISNDLETSDSEIKE